MTLKIKKLFLIFVLFQFYKKKNYIKKNYKKKYKKKFTFFIL